MWKWFVTILGTVISGVIVWYITEGSHNGEHEKILYSPNPAITENVPDVPPELPHPSG